MAMLQSANSVDFAGATWFPVGRYESLDNHHDSRLVGSRPRYGRACWRASLSPGYVALG